MKDINDLGRWEAFCERLLQKTQAGEIEWSDWTDKISRLNSRSSLFVASYKSWNILIYKYAYKHFHDEEQYDWVDEVCVELIDDGGATKWTLPKVPSQFALFDYVQFKQADVESLFCDMMGESDAR